MNGWGDEGMRIVVLSAAPALERSEGKDLLFKKRVLRCAQDDSSDCAQDDSSDCAQDDSSDCTSPGELVFSSYPLGLPRAIFPT